MNTRPSPSPASRGIHEDLLDLVRLHFATLYQPGVGRAIVERFGAASAALSSQPQRLREIPGVTGAVLGKLFSRDTEHLAREELRRAAGEGVSLLAVGQAEYPGALLALPGMPCLLYLWGRLEGCAEAVSIVGSRRPTQYGLKQARRFAAGLVNRGFAVVSGLALGIDGEAHRAALDERGATIAVLGSGLGSIYPPEHRDLARRIVESGRGAVLSELPLGAPPRSFHFPMRNRILSGLSAALLVVEAGEKSGSLITVSHALDQGKPIYSVPGRVDRPESMGCLRLLVDGAAPALGPEDVLPGAGRTLAVGAMAQNPDAPLDGRLGAKLSALFSEDDAWHPDAIAERIGVPPSDVIAELSRLELDGRLRRLPGGAYGRRA